MKKEELIELAIKKIEEMPVPDDAQFIMYCSQCRQPHIFGKQTNKKCWKIKKQEIKTLI
jgi:hypothetical protein